MEVHAPHEPVHTWKDFFTHILIVTIGLFIALMLEAVVEWVHHRHIVHEARERIHQEISDNHTAAQKDLVLLASNMERMNKNLETLRALRTRPKNFHGSLTNTMEFNSLQDSAWKSAVDMGALAYMPYGEVQSDAEIYDSQALVSAQIITAFSNEINALAPTRMGYPVDHLPDADYVAMMEADARIAVQLDTLHQLVQQLDTQYATALNGNDAHR